MNDIPMTAPYDSLSKDQKRDLSQLVGRVAAHAANAASGQSLLERIYLAGLLHGASTGSRT